MEVAIIKAKEKKTLKRESPPLSAKLLSCPCRIPPFLKDMTFCMLSGAGICFKYQFAMKKDLILLHHSIFLVLHQLVILNASGCTLHSHLHSLPYLCVARNSHHHVPSDRCACMVIVPHILFRYVFPYCNDDLTAHDLAVLHCIYRRVGFQIIILYGRYDKAVLVAIAAWSSLYSEHNKQPSETTLQLSTATRNNS